MTLSGSASGVMSVTGSKSTTRRSASLPDSTVPRSSSRRSSAAAFFVPATIASIGVRPSSTAWTGSRRFSPWGQTPESVPSATRTPAAKAAARRSRAIADQVTFFSYR
ncbi:Uncharacterised protein [Mycobacteroides abscessus subsp. abscessus]|nr:Uncharacterised protein [Mycobacteroides abscessus subsp. abscessus]